MQHIIFSSSAAGTLRQALHARGQNIRVIDFSACLDWGPLEDGNFYLREKWFDQYVPYGPSMWSGYADHIEDLCDEVTADVDRLVWVAPRAAHELAGFYWYLQKFGDDRTQIIIADYVLGVGASRTEAPFGLGELNIDAMGELLDEAPRSHWDRSRFPPDKWSQLVAENALLRVVENGELQSAQDDYFDHLLLNRCSNDWTDKLRLIGNAMCDALDVGHQVSDNLLLWRMRVLAKNGVLVSDGELRFGAKERVKVRLTGKPLVGCRP
ncbi:hypothetical protein FHW96_004910 [Novosphingobium sp. SG751A]|uniref:DUF3658 domain-containing protein n=1 Tax=Novosphingobium sp. SG751A TaxID=2587000 RepID=UPI001557594F|nr:DUF3658 domain-containing protein [Novosphingobium sp. SG751A]NOW48720.1 hypothetical protein [Novosphingobium sp. SG751A]